MDGSIETVLKTLTVKQLHEIAEQHQIRLTQGKKQEIITSLLQSQISKSEWQTILLHAKPKSTKITPQSSRSTQSIPSISSTSSLSTNNFIPPPSSLEQRVSSLEMQVQQILSYLSNLSRNSQSSISTAINLPSTQIISRVKFEITSQILPGESMTIDELLTIPSCQSLPKPVFDQIIIELIDDAIFDGAEANSHLKIRGKIGRIIRRK